VPSLRVPASLPTRQNRSAMTPVRPAGSAPRAHTQGLRTRRLASKAGGRAAWHLERGTRRVQLVREEGTRRVQLVREGGGVRHLERGARVQEVPGRREAIGADGAERWEREVPAEDLEDVAARLRGLTSLRLGFDQPDAECDAAGDHGDLTRREGEAAELGLQHQRARLRHQQ
jgi:hypothetical protein